MYDEEQEQVKPEDDFNDLLHSEHQEMDSRLYKVPPKRENRKSRGTNYVDPVEMYEAFKRWNDVWAESGLEETPRVSEEIGKMLLLIAQNLATRSNFSNYPMIDDMISDGIIQMLHAVPNFDVEKYNKPFAYFNRICWRAFTKRIVLSKAVLHKRQEIIAARGVECDTFTVNAFDTMDNFYNVNEPHLTEV